MILLPALWTGLAIYLSKAQSYSQNTYQIQLQMQCLLHQRWLEALRDHNTKNTNIDKYFLGPVMGPKAFRAKLNHIKTALNCDTLFQDYGKKLISC